MHFVFRSEKAKNRLAFVSHDRQIQALIKNISLRYEIKIHDLAINFNHIHIVVQLSNQILYKQWVRHLTSAIVEYLNRRFEIKLQNFFTLRPYSRIISCWAQFKHAMNYQILNQLEVVGLRAKKKHKKRQHKLIT